MRPTLVKVEIYVELYEEVRDRGCLGEKASAHEQRQYLELLIRKLCEPIRSEFYHC